jgi:hypothetical protein
VVVLPFVSETSTTCLPALPHRRGWYLNELGDVYLGDRPSAVVGEEQRFHFVGAHAACPGLAQCRDVHTSLVAKLVIQRTTLS